MHGGVYVFISDADALTGFTRGRFSEIYDMNGKSDDQPTTNGDNGMTHDPETGRFLQGTPGGPGNPHTRKVANLRRALLEAVTDADLRDIISAMIERAKSGDIAAAREILDRLFGKAKQGIGLEAKYGGGHFMTLEERVEAMRDMLKGCPDYVLNDIGDALGIQTRIILVDETDDADPQAG